MVAGTALVFWAQFSLGCNWVPGIGTHRSHKLIMTGPYQWIRHPIYTGILLASIGTAVALSWAWLIAVALAGVYFSYSAMVEERNLTEQFPDTYPAYRRSTKMILPFMF